MAAVGVGALAAPAPALAADLPAAPNLVADPAEADRDFVRWLSVHDPRATVRSVARSALLGDTATAFLTSGYTSAVDLAARNRARQLDYANRMASTHPAQFYPWVNATAQRAANGTDAELAAYSSTGYAAALANDNAKVPYDDGAAQVTQADRNFVRLLVIAGTGATVQDRAAYAETDAEVAELVRYGWLSAAGIDADTFRAQYVADEWTRWRDARVAAVSAAAAEQAAQAGTASPAAAIQGWRNLLTRCGRNPTGWAGLEQFARARADAWTRILQTTSLPAAVANLPGVRAQWLSEATGAAERSAWWNDLIVYAQAATDAWADADI
ncbi:hypothetical protein Ato02nite_092980 [Paractinoplanes toevensis]|uniref:Uncharacterized protein n=1 Tax=Paractinoplanes toevensis TaxID=571911 RepID=A0A919WC76_9ACTN|nr:hypothetical protein Ato02nite_092980 [Actinoplanes toevensis]